MPRPLSLAGAALLAASSSIAFGQDFDAASVRRSGPGAVSQMGFKTGGPGSSDPETIRYSAYVLRLILGDAYGVRAAFIAGPDWLDSEKYDIAAKIPLNTTLPQFQLILQRLLADRFKLTIHRGTRQETSYQLTVAPTGPKLKAAAEQPAVKGDPIDPRRSPLTTDRNGFPEPRPGSLAASATADGVTRWTYRGMSTSVFSGTLARWLTPNVVSGGVGTIAVVTPVEDKTGLTGKYDFNLEYQAPGPGEILNASYLSSILEKQIGLKLEQKKRTLNVIFIDHIEKEPGAN